MQYKNKTNANIANLGVANLKDDFAPSPQVWGANITASPPVFGEPVRCGGSLRCRNWRGFRGHLKLLNKEMFNRKVGSDRC